MAAASFHSFHDEVARYWQENGITPQEITLARQTVDLEQLWNHVVALGGFDAVCDQKAWARVGRSAFNPQTKMTDLSFKVKKMYTTHLLDFEQAVREGRYNLTLQAVALDPAGPAASRKRASETSAPTQPQQGKKRGRPKKLSQHDEGSAAQDDSGEPGHPHSLGLVQAADPGEDCIIEAPDYKVYKRMSPPGYKVVCPITFVDAGRDDIKVKCWDSGTLTVRNLSAPSQESPIQETKVELPTAVMANTARAYLSPDGSLEVNIDCAMPDLQSKSEPTDFQSKSEPTVA